MRVDVVRAVPRPADALAGLLSDVERARLARMLVPGDRDRFATGRAVLREAVAGWLGCAPADVVVDATCPTCEVPHGRPVVTGPDGRPGPRVSIAHAGDVVLVAVTDAGPVGVDVDVVASVAFDGFDDVALTRAEHAALQTIPAADRDRERARLWVRKEALLKATGTGLTVPPSSVDVLAPRHCVLTDLDVAPGYAAALAVLAPGPIELRLSAAAAGPAARWPPASG